MVWNYQNADCSFKKKFIIISGTLRFPIVKKCSAAKGLFTAYELNWTDLQQVDPVTRHVHWSHVSASQLYRERKCAENYNKWQKKFFLNCSQHFGNFKLQQLPSAVWKKLLSVYFFAKYVYIFALELSSPGNQHCASSIGTDFRFLLAAAKLGRLVLSVFWTRIPMRLFTLEFSLCAVN